MGMVPAPTRDEMTNETDTKNLVAAVAERDRRIAELTQSLLDAADKIDAAQARVAALEAALTSALPVLDDVQGLLSDSHGVAGYHRNGDVAEWDEFEGMPNATVAHLAAKDALFGGTQALDAAVRAAVDAERARVRAAVEALDVFRATPTQQVVLRADVLASIGGA